MNIYFESYGCTLNSGEEEKMRKIASSLGHSIASNPVESDLAVILTCTVIESTELKMLKRISELKMLNKPLVVAGCMASVQPEIIKQIAPDSIFISTPGQVNGFKDFLKDGKAALIDKNIEVRETPYPEIKMNSAHNDVSTGIPIAEGCLGSCNYCITRLARGKLRSYPLDEIKSDIEASLAFGTAEIRLTAQDSSTYGMDHSDSGKLPELLFSLGEIYSKYNNRFRVRVGMMNPNSTLPILDELIKAYSEPYIFKFLHLPVQSGSDKILEEMGRNYKVDLFRKIVFRFREAFPNLSLSTDIIVGYPGEREEDHKLTIKLLEEIRPNIVNITRFSSRPGTPASEQKNILHGRTIKARSRELTELCQNISFNENKKLKNSEFTVLATERDISHYKNTTLARTEEYKPVVVNDVLELGEFYQIKVTSTTSSYLIGEII